MGNFHTKASILLAVRKGEESGEFPNGMTEEEVINMMMGFGIEDEVDMIPIEASLRERHPSRADD